MRPIATRVRVYACRQTRADVRDGDSIFLGSRLNHFRKDGANLTPELIREGVTIKALPLTLMTDLVANLTEGSSAAIPLSFEKQFFKLRTLNFG